MTLTKAFLPVLLLVTVASPVVTAQEKDLDAYPDHVAKYLQRLYDETSQPLVFQPDFPGGFARWHGNQHANAGTWVSLGTYHFQGGNADYVSLNDVTYEPYLSTRIAFDAVKWVPR